MRAQMSNDLAAGLPRRPQKIFAPPRAFGSPRPAAPPPPAKDFYSLFCQKVDISAAKEYNSSIKKGGTTMAAKKDYFGLSYLVSVILAIIPVTSWVCGFVTRFMEGKILAGILRLLLGWNIIWILDLIFMIISHKIFRILPI